MESAAFARAQSFLNYSPLAKWLAIVSGVVTAILYVALLVVLALFADLMVNRGEIPCLANLPTREWIQYTAEEYPLPDDFDARKKRISDISEGLRNLGVQGDTVVSLATTDQTGTLTPRETELRRAMLWFVDLPEILRTTVGEEAAQAARRKIREQIQTLGVDAAVHTNLANLGMLSLVVRSRSSLQGTLVAPLARWNDWMWADGNAAFLRGLFAAALVLAFVRACFLFLNNSMAAQATVEAITRLRLALHKHAYRLGTLAFRALGPTEAVSVSTRHLEAVHTGLFAWLTVSFREPVKFALLLLFALLVEFWLALAFLLFALLVWLVGGQIAAYFRRQGRAAGARAADQLAYIQESLMILRLVKAYLIEKFNLARAETQLAKYAQAQLQRYRGEAFYRPFFAFLGVLAALVLLLAAGHVILN
ncbi:MAG: ABC transporter ATP-binding protein, partial [Planctomycetes bacterium]|nr:ABC transporter ATP-binding protein [Planctomycetota bacterium]